MIEVLISFIYITVFCLCIGAGISKLFGRIYSMPEANVTRLVINGVITLTVLVGWISIFTNIGAGVHVCLLLTAIGCAVYSRQEIRSLIRANDLKWPEYICALIIVLIISYACSRGSFHTDTGIYHAAAIRVYEEYGVVKGLANIQQHYGYNSSYLGFAALFTMSGVLPSALHTTTGFLMSVLALDALYYLRNIKQHRSHYTDAVRIITLFYIFINYTGTISPATDYGTMLMTCYFLNEWALASETARIEESRDHLGILAVYGLFLTTMKLSAAMCVIVVILPVIYMVRLREAGKILAFTGTGLLSFAFYPIRNIILSGWLLYPYGSIDLFNVEWKVPKEYLLTDAAQIKVWGRCLFDVDRINDPVKVWLPVWWEAQEHYYQMLIYACILSFIIILLTVLIKKKIDPGIGIMYMMILANIAVWFFSAPFVRYGLVFLMALPAMAAAGIIDRIRYRDGMIRYVGGVLVLLVCVCFCALTDHYLMDNLVFIKHEIKSPYYIQQKPFDNGEMNAAYPGGGSVAVYYTVNDNEINSYYTPPSSCYYHMLERSEPMGDDVRDGFRSRQ